MRADRGASGAGRARWGQRRRPLCFLLAAAPRGPLECLDPGVSSPLAAGHPALFGAHRQAFLFAVGLCA